MKCYVSCLKVAFNSRLPKYVAFVILAKIPDEIFKYGLEPMQKLPFYIKLVGCAFVNNLAPLGELTTLQKQVAAHTTVHIDLIKELRKSVVICPVWLVQCACRKKNLDLIKFILEESMISPLQCLTWSVRYKAYNITSYLQNKGVENNCIKEAAKTNNVDWIYSCLNKLVTIDQNVVKLIETYCCHSTKKKLIQLTGLNIHLRGFARSDISKWSLERILTQGNAAEIDKLVKTDKKYLEDFRYICRNFRAFTPFHREVVYKLLSYDCGFKWSREVLNIAESTEELWHLILVCDLCHKEALRQVIESGKVEFAYFLLERFPPNHFLFLSAIYGNTLEIFKHLELMGLKADNKIFMNACYNGRMDFVKYMVEKKIGKKRHGAYAAISSFSNSIFEYLVKFCTHKLNSLLYCAAKVGNWQAVEICLMLGAKNKKNALKISKKYIICKKTQKLLLN